MTLWYLRRAVSWKPVFACLSVSIALVIAARLSGTLAALALPLAALTAAAAASFAFDDKAIAITTVAARGGRWALAVRCSAATITFAVGLAALLTVPRVAGGDRTGWALIMSALTAVVLFADVLAARRQNPNPSVLIAPAIVLAGLAPLVVGFFLGWESPYPQPELAEVWRVLWSVLLVVSLAGVTARIRAV